LKYDIYQSKFLLGFSFLFFPDLKILLIKLPDQNHKIYDFISYGKSLQLWKETESSVYQGSILSRYLIPRISLLISLIFFQILCIWAAPPKDRLCFYILLTHCSSLHKDACGDHDTIYVEKNDLACIVGISTKP
jgi:hypothetical protein